MRLTASLLAVRDVLVARRFYEELLGLRVVLDLGDRVVLEGGLVLHQRLPDLLRVPRQLALHENGDHELFFETEDFDTFLAQLDSTPGISYLHPVHENEWRQRVVCFYDPDGHIVAIAEAMAQVAARFKAEGLSLQDTSALVGYAPDLVSLVLNIEP